MQFFPGLCVASLSTSEAPKWPPAGAMTDLMGVFWGAILAPLGSQENPGGNQSVSPGNPH